MERRGNPLVSNRRLQVEPSGTLLKPGDCRVASNGGTSKKVEFSLWCVNPHKSLRFICLWIKERLDAPLTATRRLRPGDCFATLATTR